MGNQITRTPLAYTLMLVDSRKPSNNINFDEVVVVVSYQNPHPQERKRVWYTLSNIWGVNLGHTAVLISGTPIMFMACDFIV